MVVYVLEDTGFSRIDFRIHSVWESFSSLENEIIKFNGDKFLGFNKRGFIWFGTIEEESYSIELRVKEYPVNF